jgi:hypothetical protein
MLEAYAAATALMGTATNRFYCVSASCLGNTLPGWIFSFSNTNGEMAHIEYYFGGKFARVPDANSEALLKQ